MSPNIPPGNIVLPGVFSEGEVVSTGLSVPGQNRLLCIIGEGRRREVLVNYAEGNGNDGLDPTYTSTTGADGRHFQLSKYPIVARHTTLSKNGVTLTGIEEAISSTPFSHRYDYRIEIATGKIELQASYIYNQGGVDYVPSSANQGDGYINNLTLIDDGAPEETWTVRCIGIRRDGYGNPVDGYARFSCFGSKSGNVLDEYGSVIVWQSDGYVRNNGILRFSISEGLSAFNVGDTFTIMVKSGVLASADNLIANYIATLDINDPEVFTEMDSVTAKHGLPSTSNTLSLGCQIAFANNVPQVLCCQAAPGLPTRTEYTLIEAANGGSDLQDLMFPLPLNVTPDTDTEIKFFTVNPTTNERVQIIPNKETFWNATFTSNPSAFCLGPYVYSYTVIEKYGLLNSGEGGTITPNPVPTTATFEAGVTFNTDDYSANYRLIIFGSAGGLNDGVFTITGVSDGKLTISGGAPFVSETSTDLNWRLEDYATLESSTILFTQDLALTSGYGLICSVVDSDDATFYDAGWTAALEKLEAFELDMLVPLPTTTISSIFQSCLAHCLAMSQIKNRKERVLIIGAIQGLLPKNVTGDEDAAVEDLGVLEGIQGDDPLEISGGNVEDLTNYSISDAFGSTYRCIYMYPDQIVVNISGTNTYVSGYYMAAALGGWFGAQGQVQMPATNKNLAGFSILRDRTYSTYWSERIVQAGACLVEPILGGGRIVWGKTTSQSGFVEEEEASIVFIRDRVAKVSRLVFRGFIGQPESDTFSTTLITRANGMLNSFINQGIITKYANVVVVRDLVDPRQWNLKFSIMPTYSINWIYIKFSIGTF